MVTRVKELAGVEPNLKAVLARFLWGYGGGAPVDGSTGAGSCPVGGLYVNTINGTIYRNAGTKASPTWTEGVADTDWHLNDNINIEFATTAVATLGYDATEKCVTYTPTRPSATDPAYAYGQVWDNSSVFSGTGAVKGMGLYLTGSRDDAVMGGDANDMQLKIDYTNEAVTSPAGAYARGLSVQMNNKTAGVLSALQGAFIGVRQRSTGDCGSLEGLQIDVKIDSGKLAPTTEIRGLAVELNLCANAPAASYGVIVSNITDGVYTVPTAAFKATNTGTNSCPGFSYGLDLMSSLAIASGKTVVDADIRFSQKDANELPCCLFTGTGTSDGTIVSDVGADTLWADGSIYIGVLDGAGTLWQKRNDVWVNIVS